MKKLAVLAALVLTATAANTASAQEADTGSGADGAAVGVEFGYPGNIGLSLRFGHVPINLAWSSDYLHGTLDYWILHESLAPDAGAGLNLYIGPGLDAGIPLDNADAFALAIRVPIGLQLMVTDRVETFAELAPGVQVVDEVDFYWAGNLGIRIVL